jgi:hypothetical protein
MTMLAIRSTSRLAAIAAAAGACLILAGCGGGSAGGAAAAGNTSSAAASASSSSTGSGSAGSGSGSAVAGFPAPKLTGHFCTDFTNIGKSMPKIPAADRNMAFLQAHGSQFFKAAAAYFTGLANEAPPQAAGELKIIASAYDSLSSGSVTASSVAQLEKQMGAITTHGKTGQAFISLVSYLTTHCH